MLTGRRAFVGASDAALIGNILHADPPAPSSLERLDPLTRGDLKIPTELERILTTALRKDRAQRYQTAQDLLLDLQGLRDEVQVQARSATVPVPFAAGGVSTSTAAGTWPYRRWALLSLVVAVLLVGAGAIWWRVSAPQPPTQQVFREPRLVRVTAQPAEDPVRTACVSPDGRYVAFSDTAGVHVQVIASGEAHVIPHTEKMDVFAWSADGFTIKAGNIDGRTYASWDVPLLRGEPRRSGVQWPASDIVAFAPDASAIARLTDSGEIWIEKLDGSASDACLPHGARRQR